ncbi:MAG: hypothetical protein AAGD96_13525 [Chloroflexota bacterium]
MPTPAWATAINFKEVPMFQINTNQWKSLQKLMDTVGKTADDHVTFSVSQIKGIHPQTSDYLPAISATLNCMKDKKMVTGFVTIWPCGLMDVGAYRVDNKSKKDEFEALFKRVVF